MNKKNDLIHKPNQTIMISNGEITPTQRKAYNIILQQAWHDLRLNNNQTLFIFNIHELKEKAGIDSKNDNRLKDDIIKLRHIDIEIVKENGDWAIFSLISQAEKKGNTLEVELPQKIRQALIENTYYTTLDLLIIKTLKGKYAIILYEIAIRYQKVQIPELTLEELRILTGTDGRKSYNNFNDFEKRVLKPAIEEINEKTDIEISYKTKKRGKKVISIKFELTNKKEPSALVMLKNKNTIQIFIQEIQLRIKNKLGIDISIKDLSILIENHGEDRVNYYTDNLYKVISLSAPKDQILNYFKSAVIKNWDLEKNTTSRLPQLNFEQRKYSDEDYDKCYSNLKQADSD